MINITGGLLRLSCIGAIAYAILYFVNPYNPYDDLQPVMVTAKYIPVTNTKKESAVKCLQENLYFEAADQGREGMIAVANVTMNRARSNGYPHDVCAVVHQLNIKAGQRICQFTWYCEPPKPVLVRSAAWKLAGTIAKAALQGTIDNLVQDARFYHAAYITPPWAEEKALVIQIGDHMFYR